MKTEHVLSTLENSTELTESPNALIRRIQIRTSKRLSLTPGAGQLRTQINNSLTEE